MKYALVSALAIGALASGGSAADDQKAVSGDAKALQGKWTVASGQVDGLDAPAEFVKTGRFVFDGDTLNIEFAERQQPAKFTLDSTKKPRTIDLVATTGADKGMTVMGIYELAGDTLRLAFSETARPTEFTSKEKKSAYFVLKRAKS